MEDRGAFEKANRHPVDSEPQERDEDRDYGESGSVRVERGQRTWSEEGHAAGRAEPSRHVDRSAATWARRRRWDHRDTEETNGGPLVMDSELSSSRARMCDIVIGLSQEGTLERAAERLGGRSFADSRSDCLAHQNTARTERGNGPEPLFSEHVRRPEPTPLGHRGHFGGSHWVGFDGSSSLFPD